MWIKTSEQVPPRHKPVAMLYLDGTARVGRRGNGHWWTANGFCSVPDYWQDVPDDVLQVQIAGYAGAYDPNDEPDTRDCWLTIRDGKLVPVE